MRVRQRLFLILVLVSSILLGAACGAGYAPAAENSYQYNAAPAGSMEAPMSSAAMPRGDPGGDAQASLAAMPASEVARKVIASGDMTLVVADTATAVSQIEAMLEEVGGYVSNSNLYKSSYGGADLLRGSLTIRVPAGQLKRVIERLHNLAVDVRNENIGREDVTDQYSDIEAQLRNLRATEEELRALLSEVRERRDATPEDILAVHNSITNIRGQIEQLQGRQNMYDNLIALSTLNLELVPDVINQPIVESGWRPAVIARDAARALVSTLTFLGNAAIWIGIYLVPLILIALIPISVIIWGLRRLGRRLGRKPAAQPQG
jgi:hypothetical protein